jgi:hypothetical protein
LRITAANSTSKVTAAGRNPIERVECSDDAEVGFVVFAAFFFAGPIWFLREGLSSEFIDDGDRCGWAMTPFPVTPVDFFTALGKRPVLVRKFLEVVSVAHERQGYHVDGT